MGDLSIPVLPGVSSDHLERLPRERLEAELCTMALCPPMPGDCRVRHLEEGRTQILFDLPSDEAAEVLNRLDRPDDEIFSQEKGGSAEPPVLRLSPLERRARALVEMVSETFNRRQRRALRYRDNNCCRVPGCTNTRRINGHHVAVASATHSGSTMSIRRRLRRRSTSGGARSLASRASAG